MLRCKVCDKKTKEGQQHYCKVGLTSRIAELNEYFTRSSILELPSRFCRWIYNSELAMETHKEQRESCSITLLSTQDDILGTTEEKKEIRNDCTNNPA